MTNLQMKETTVEDLSNVQALWGNGEVMQYVGAPEGIAVTIQQLEDWLNKVQSNALSKHYSIYEETIGYCGEAFYEIDTEHDLGTLDIKLIKEARGKGIAYEALSYTLDAAYQTGKCTKAYVEPVKSNVKAWALYEKLGFVSKPRPAHLESNEVYLEIDLTKKAID